MLNQTQKPPSHFCGLVVVRSNEVGKVEFLVVDYTEDGFTQVKFPGGGSKGRERPFLDMMNTLRREVGEELGDDQLPPDQQITITLDDTSLEERLVFKLVVSPNHCKYFYVVADTELAGTFRQREILDGYETLGIPRWISAEELSESIFRTHHSPFIATLTKLSECEVNIRGRYAKLL